MHASERPTALAEVNSWRTAGPGRVELGPSLCGARAHRLMRVDAVCVCSRERDSLLSSAGRGVPSTRSKGCTRKQAMMTVLSSRCSGLQHNGGTCIPQQHRERRNSDGQRQQVEGAAPCHPLECQHRPLLPAMRRLLRFRVRFKDLANPRFMHFSTVTWLNHPREALSRFTPERRTYGT